ncbi:TauD/TfdA family dioxygenase [Vibrio sp. S4M6]|uniref:TauD/TfdA dioxygenase family protein n=1 Tax=Vibrio sinus TaxID=2946865 RepID=UPI00202A9370|nr:TauD/TfdA family dioxygenase [Vibrio sinus]
MNIQPLAKHLGAIVDGVDLRKITVSEFAQLHAAYLQFKVLFFRNQELSLLEHVSLAERFGEIEPPHPFFPCVDEDKRVSIIETSRGNPPSQSYWHTDLTWQQVPSRCSILHAKHCPESGGDTIWTSMEAVWQSLTEVEKSCLLGYTATHALHAFQGSRYDSVDDVGLSRVVEISKAFPPVVHPVVSRHPETNNKSLFINEQFTRQIDQLGDIESKAMLEKLFKVARNEEYQVRLSWDAGTVAIWDNYCTQHYAVTDYADSPRKLHRVSVRGTPMIAAG